MPEAEEGPLLALTRAWTLVRFVKVDYCNFPAATAAAAILLPTSPACWQLCLQLMSTAIPGSKRRKLSQNPADIIPQLLDEQEYRLFN